MQVLEHVRLPLLSPYFLHDCVESQAVVRQSPECRHLVEEAKMFHLLPDRRAELQSPRTRHRNSAGTIQVHMKLQRLKFKVCFMWYEFCKT
jgi:hypothetical protein